MVVVGGVYVGEGIVCADVTQAIPFQVYPVGHLPVLVTHPDPLQTDPAGQF